MLKRTLLLTLLFVSVLQAGSYKSSNTALFNPVPAFCTGAAIGAIASTAINEYIEVPQARVIKKELDWQTRNSARQINLPCENIRLTELIRNYNRSIRNPHLWAINGRKNFQELDEAVDDKISLSSRVITPAVGALFFGLLFVGVDQTYSWLTGMKKSSK
jgi:hypothetical protein